MDQLFRNQSIESCDDFAVEDTPSWIESAAPQPWHNPLGTENLDPGAFCAERQQRLNHRKADLRRQNEQYLEEHPDISMTLSMLIEDLLTKRPQNVVRHVANFFFDPDLESIVDEKLREQKEKDAVLARAARMAAQDRRRMHEFGAWKTLRHYDEDEELERLCQLKRQAEEDERQRAAREAAEREAAERKAKKKKKGGKGGKDGEGGKDGFRDGDGVGDGDGGKGKKGRKGSNEDSDFDPFRDCLPSCRSTCRILGGHVPPSRLDSFEAPLAADLSFDILNLEDKKSSSDEARAFSEEQDNLESFENTNRIEISNSNKGDYFTTDNVSAYDDHGNILDDDADDVASQYSYDKYLTNDDNQVEEDDNTDATNEDQRVVEVDHADKDDNQDKENYYTEAFQDNNKVDEGDYADANAEKENVDKLDETNTFKNGAEEDANANEVVFWDDEYCVDYCRETDPNEKGNFVLDAFNEATGLDLSAATFIGAATAAMASADAIDTAMQIGSVVMNVAEFGAAAAAVHHGLTAAPKDDDDDAGTKIRIDRRGVGGESADAEDGVGNESRFKAKEEMEEEVEEVDEELEGE